MQVLEGQGTTAPYKFRKRFLPLSKSSSFSVVLLAALGRMHLVNFASVSKTTHGLSPDQLIVSLIERWLSRMLDRSIGVHMWMR